MKKIKLLSCIVGLLISIPTSFGAVSNDVCDASPPSSCFYADDKGDQRKIIINTPTHCHPGITNLFGLIDQTVIHAWWPNDGGIMTKEKMKSMQKTLLESCGWTDSGDGASPGPGCAPEGSIPETEADDSNTTTCKLEDFVDGKYGICTREALRRFQAWKKATTLACDDPLSLEITPPDNPEEGEETSISIGAITGGSIWVWADDKADVKAAKFIAIDSNK